jgi:hypothetical protein
MPQFRADSGIPWTSVATVKKRRSFDLQGAAPATSVGLTAKECLQPLHSLLHRRSDLIVFDGPADDFPN